MNSRPRLFEIKKSKVLKKWTKEEDSILIDLTNKFNNKNWNIISSHFEDKTPLQCFSRYKRIRPGIIKGSWTREEDQKILELVNQYGRLWSKISKVLISRNGKQIRDRYINILDPSIKKGKFSLEEDLKLLNLYKKLGPRWATIAKFFENRTADMVKNRFHSSIKKNIKFLEDVESENKQSYLSYSTQQATEECSKYEFSQDSNSNNNQTYIKEHDNQSMTITDNIEEDKYFCLTNVMTPPRKTFNNLFVEKAAELNFSNGINDAYFMNNDDFNSSLWQFDDYFIM